MRSSPTCALCLLASSFQAQNLVNNGDFEAYSACPDYVSQIDRAIGWSRPTNGTSDYFNACLGVPFSMNVPDNQMGDQAALSGNGYAGIYAFYENNDVQTQTNPYREYVTHALDTPMIPGTAYHIAFRVSLADVSKFAVDDLGALLSTTIPHRDDESPIVATPQVTHGSGSWLDDKNGWTLIEGCLIADSAYAFITIGNFNAPENTPFLEVSTDYPLTWFCYYYVEDVEVSALPRPDLGPDVEMCEATTLQVIDPQDAITYVWSTGATGTTIAVDSSGTYTVEVLSNVGCVVADTIIVSIYPHFPLDLDATVSNDFCLAPMLTLNTGPLPLGAEAHWSTGMTGAVCDVFTPGPYTVTVSSPGHCPTSATMEVVNTCAEGVYVPNAFSPDLDGRNEIWQPVNLGNSAARMHLRVFDRWGSVVLDQHAPDPAWDGTLNGAPAPAGLYVWRLDIRDEGIAHDLTITGHVTLLR